jgi:hypothetical protein
VIVLLTQGVRFGLSAAARQARGQETAAALEPAGRALRGLIAAMDPGTYTEPPHIVGTSTSLAFTTDIPTGSGAPQRADVEIVAAGGRLVMRWRPRAHVVPLAASALAVQETVLLDGVDIVRFGYAAQPGQPFADAWHAEVLPRLIRIDAQRGGRPVIPRLFAAPVRDAPEQ